MSSPPPVSPGSVRTPQSPLPHPPRTPVSGFPFPHHDSPGRRASKAGNARARSTSNASSVVSLSTIRSADGTIAEAHSNAISALLKPPIIRTGLLPHTYAHSGIRPPSTRDIPPVTLTNIPHVESSAFSSYVSQAGSLYEALRRAREESEPNNRRHSAGRRGSEQDGGGLQQYHGMQRRPSATPGTPTSLGVPSTPLEGPATLRRKGSAEIRRRPGLAVAPLSTIPSIYFEEDFHLENPRTFDVVSEKSEIVRKPAGRQGQQQKEKHNDEGQQQQQQQRKALAANAVLQEKLSWYMDTVEIHLIASIATASTSFFDALKSLRELHAEAEASVQQIDLLREDLGKLDRDMAVSGLEVVAMKRKRDNLQKLAGAVKQVEEVMKGFSICEGHIGNGKTDDALGELNRLEKLVVGDVFQKCEKNQAQEEQLRSLIDLRQLKVLETACDDIAYLRRKVGALLEAQFITSLLGDLRQHVDKVPQDHTFKRWDQASSRRRGQHTRTLSELNDPPAFMEVNSEFRKELMTQLRDLARSDSIMQATFTYREAVQKEFKNLIRRHLPSSSDEDAESITSVSTTASRSRTAQERSSVLARNLRALEPGDVEDMYKKIYSNVGEALRRLGTQVKLLLDITSSLEAPPSSVARSPGRNRTMSPQVSTIKGRLQAESEPVALIPQEEIQQVLDLSSLLGQVVDISQNQITKLLKVRAEQSTQLDIPTFLRYFTLNRLFADECEAVSGRSGMALKTVVQDHIKSFVQIVGDAEKQSLVRKMDADTWDARDFGTEESARLNTITEASTKEIESWLQATIIWSGESSKPTTNGTTVNGLGIAVPTIEEPATSFSVQPAVDQTANDIATPFSRPATPAGDTKASKPTVRAAELDNQTFLLPSSATAVISGLVTYLQLVTCIPALAPDIAISLLDYLRIFNSRSQQLILGAGATRSAGLKNITTKHLALSSQALSFVAALVPYIREFVRRYLPSGGANSGVLADFDKVKRTLQEHQTGIEDKLVDIMQGRATAHVVSFKKIDWEKGDSGNVGAYMETLVRETTMLQKVLSRHLPRTTVRSIMAQVMKGYSDVWGKGFGIVEVRSQAAKDRLRRDAEYFRSRIGRLEAAGDIGDYVVGIVDQKKVAGSDQSTVAGVAPATQMRQEKDNPDAGEVVEAKEKVKEDERLKAPAQDVAEA